MAEEVRNLAQRSAKAAKETAEMIEGSIQKTEIGAKIAEETSKALEEIVLGTAKVTDLIGEIASASKEQAVGIGQINEGLNQVDQVTQQNSAGSEELAAASEEMSSQAAMVKQMLDKFTLRKQGFTGAPAVAATTKSLAAHQLPVQERNWGIKNKPVKKGVLEVAAAKDAGVKPQDIISLNDAEFGNF
ncbi:Methyl-accepting chemotaxis protein IV [Pelotomaculum sp. FP]|nr:Methyl-accepting chemotaxis protein IV [Pelotomaculum sp. FP]